MLNGMVKNKMLAIHGAGASTNYSIEGTASIKKDAAMRFTNTERKKEITMVNQGSFLEIKKIVLTPLFTWSHPDEWSAKLIKNGLMIEITLQKGLPNTGYDRIDRHCW
jgi:hypothetical protein